MRSLKISHVAREREKEKKRPKKGFEWKNRIHALLRKLMLHFCSAINICIGLFAFVSFALKIVDVKKIRYKYCEVGSPKICDFFSFFFSARFNSKINHYTKWFVVSFFLSQNPKSHRWAKKFPIPYSLIPLKIVFSCRKKPSRKNLLYSKQNEMRFICAKKKIRNSFLCHKLFD